MDNSDNSLIETLHQVRDEMRASREAAESRSREDLAYQKLIHKEQEAQRRGEHRIRSLWFLFFAFCLVVLGTLVVLSNS